MDPRTEAVARSLCALDGVDPDAVVSTPDYAGELRSGDHRDGPQWQTRAREAARFLAMLDAAVPSGPPPAATGGTMMA